MQRLRKIRIGFYFTRANAGAARAAKSGEKVCRGIAIGNFDRVRAARQPGKLVLRLSDLADAVEEHFGADAADGSFAEIPVVRGVSRVRTCAELISARGTNITNEPFEIVFVFDQFRRESREQFGIGRWI